MNLRRTPNGSQGTEMTQTGEVCTRGHISALRLIVLLVGIGTLSPPRDVRAVGELIIPMALPNQTGTRGEAVRDCTVLRNDFRIDNPEHRIGTIAAQWTDREQRVRMLVSGPGREDRQYELATFEKRYADGRRDTLVSFQSPAELEGVALLSIGERGRPTARWLYIAALGRVRKMSATAERALDADVSLTELGLADQVWTWAGDPAADLVGEQEFDGAPSCGLELHPRNHDLSYPRVVAWIGREDLVLRRLEFQDQFGVPGKRIDRRSIDEVDGVGVARRIEVESLPARSQTIIDVIDVRLNHDLDERLFTPAALADRDR